MDLRKRTPAMKSEDTWEFISNILAIGSVLFTNFAFWATLVYNEPHRPNIYIQGANWLIYLVNNVSFIVLSTCILLTGSLRYYAAHPLGTDSASAPPVLKQTAGLWNSVTPTACRHNLYKIPAFKMSDTDGQGPSDSTASPRCRLVGLPAEIRLRIYDFAFPYETIYVQAAAAVHVWRKDEAWIRAFDRPPSFCGGLLRASKLIHREASPILYKRTTFNIDLKPMSHKDMPGRKICDIQDFVLGPHAQHVYLHLQHRARFYYRPRMLLEPRSKDDWGQVIGAVLMTLGYCASASHVHLELDTEDYIDDQHPLSHFEALQCSGEVSLRMKNCANEDDRFGGVSGVFLRDPTQFSMQARGALGINRRRYDPFLQDFIGRLGAKVQSCDWHK
nr:hypothetical protein B0A51_03717 [Rachicladosporium sp. CCFEE 5018]